MVMVISVHILKVALNTTHHLLDQTQFAEHACQSCWRMMTGFVIFC